MTTYYPYVPSPSAPFSFQPTFDGNIYLVTVPWNLYGQRNYAVITTLDGTPVVTIPLVPSPPSIPIASVSWANGTVTLTTATPHDYQQWLTVAVLISGCNPTAYNGNVLALVVDEMTLTYPLIQPPAAVTTVGIVDWIVNLVAGYFTTSTLAFRNGQFEVNP